MALWLNTAFAGYDYAILNLLHGLATHAGGLLTPLMKLISLLGEKGLLMFLTSLVLLCFPRTRKMGVCVFGAVCCGALITNVILKDLVARPRPFENMDLYRQWWQAVGAPAEDDFSFPSGHVTAITAGMTALCLSCRRRHRRKFIIAAVAAVLLMVISRNYLMAHYPSDVLFAALIGLASAAVAWLITRLIFRLLRRYREVPFCAFVLGFDVRELPLREWIASLRDKLPKKAELAKKEPAPVKEEEAPAPEEPVKSASEEPVKSVPEEPAEPAKPRAARPAVKKPAVKMPLGRSGYQPKH